MLKFFASTFAIAGLVAATGPIVIHLLNRHRFRVVEWAAMDFLREALKRRRRALQLRDLLLLLLRVLCVLGFGVALARPYFSQVSDQAVWGYAGIAGALVAAFGTALVAILATKRVKKTTAAILSVAALGLAAWGVYDVLRDSASTSGAAFSGRHPVHAVLVLDNSLSMGYETLKGSLLDRVKAKAIEIVEILPRESQVSVIPLCGSEGGISTDAYRTKDDAKEAVTRVELIDGAGAVLEAIRLASQACGRVPELTAKRVVFLGDQQRNAWPATLGSSELSQLPDLQVVNVTAGTPQNVWVSDFKVQDGIADVETPTVFLATVRHLGQDALPNVRVSFNVDGIDVAEQIVSLEPGQMRQLVFEHRVDIPADPGHPNFATAKVSVHSDSVGSDGLKNDNSRFLTVPVVAGLPVVFVDQYGNEEDFEKNRIGETYPFRRLLAPRTSRDDFHRQLIQIRHATVKQLDVGMLQDARLVVIAGIRSPGESVELLRQFVKQGGQLVIAAGAEFDPVEWSDRGWQQGSGILPTPLLPEPFGETPENTIGPPQPFLLDFASLHHDYFLLENEPRESLEDLYRLPLFFKAVQVDLPETAVAGTEHQADSPADEQPGQQSEADWLAWRDDVLTTAGEPSLGDLAARSRPSVLARFAGNRLPFLVEGRIGAGRVLLVTTGVHSSWNTLTRTNAVLVFDRIFRSMIEQTMPQRNYTVGETPVVAMRMRERLDYTLRRPSGNEEGLSLDALGAEMYGLTIRNALRSGRYQVTARRSAASADKSFEISLAVNGAPQESELAYLDAFDFQQRVADANVRWVEQDESISLEGVQISGRGIWKLLVKLVLIGLLLEMLVLARPGTKNGGPEPNVAPARPSAAAES